jgi:hypothetical protein
LLHFPLAEEEATAAARVERGLGRRNAAAEGSEAQAERGQAVEEAKAKAKAKAKARAKAKKDKSKESCPAVPSDPSAPADVDNAKAPWGTGETFAGRRLPRKLEGQERHRLISKLGGEHDVKSKDADAFYKHMMSTVDDDLSNAAEVAAAYIARRRLLGAVPEGQQSQKRAAPEETVTRVRHKTPKSERRQSFIGARLAEGLSLKEANRLFALQPDQVASAQLKKVMAERAAATRTAKQVRLTAFKARTAARIAKKQAEAAKAKAKAKSKAKKNAEKPKEDTDLEADKPEDEEDTDLEADKPEDEEDNKEDSQEEEGDNQEEEEEELLQEEGDQEEEHQEEDQEEDEEDHEDNPAEAIAAEEEEVAPAEATAETAPKAAGKVAPKAKARPKAKAKDKVKAKAKAKAAPKAKAKTKAKAAKAAPQPKAKKAAAKRRAQ